METRDAIQQVESSENNRFAWNPSKVPLLEVRNLTKHFLVQRQLFKQPKYVHAVDNISIKIWEGGSLGIVGESGSGKTTVGRCILRLIELTGGEIYLQGERIDTIKSGKLRRLRHKMQMVFQDPADSLNPRFTCFQALDDALYLAGMKSKKERLNRMVELLEAVGLSSSDLTKYPHQFSGGQQQRIAIARALAFNPLLLILDEPTASLDVSVKAQITELLRNLQELYHLSYILISHDLSNVRHVTQNVAVMYLGQIIETGRTKDVFRDPFHPYTRVLIDSVPVPNPAIKRERVLLKGEIPSPIKPPSGCRFHTRCPKKLSICENSCPPVYLFEDGRMVACHLFQPNSVGKDTSYER